MSTRSPRLAFAQLVAIALGVTALALTDCSSSSSSPAPAPPGPTLVTIDNGPLRGAALESTREFLGIPFAAPPVGDLRWKPPADPPAWTDVRAATTLSARCIQYNILTGAPGGGSEDCLYLNVWTPLAAVTNAPVMVFFHGGGFVFGSGNETTYDGANLAKAGNAIIVTVNYRLGPTGFLAHSSLGGSSPNYGMLDQRAALAWVQKNIAAFGGDPASVTIFGESAGAFSVCMHLVMPASRGLFQRAIMESGACDGTFYATKAQADAQANALATALGCTDAATAATCLRAKSTDELLNALPFRKYLVGPGGVLWPPIVDGADLPDFPQPLIAQGKWAKVPVVLGTNLHEGQLFTAEYGDVDVPTAIGIVKTTFGDANGDAILAQYPQASYPGPKEQVADALTDGMFVCPTRRTVRAIASSGGTAYLYQFAYPFKIALAPGATAAHGFELPFVFGNDLFGTHLDDDALPLSATMMKLWTTFAKTGDPGATPAWPAYAIASDAHLELDATLSVASGLKKDRCDFWDSLH